MRLGRLDRPIEIQRYTTVAGTAGARTRTWLKLADAWANVREIRGTETEKSDTDYPVLRVSFTVRDVSGVLPEMRVLHEGKYFEIIEIKEITYQRNRYMELITEKRGNQEGTATSLPTCADGTFQNSDGSYSIAVPSGETVTSDDITVTQIDGTQKDVPSNNDVTCLWKELQLDASDGVDIFIDGQSNNDVSSYPSGGVITVSDLTIRDGDGFSQAYPRRQRVVISGAAIQSVSQDAASTTITVPTVLPIDLVNGASGTVATISVDPSGTYTLPDLTVNGSGSHAIPTTNIQVNQADGSAATINSVTEGASQLTIVVPNEGVTAATKLLDETGVGSALMAFSVRKLRDNYTGAALRVRRASDNDEADIFFEGEDLNIDQLESFCSGTNGFVTTWYDQSNNGHDFTRSIAGSQPQIVSNGSAILENGKVAMQYDGTSDSLLNSDTIKATPSNYTVSAVHNRSDFNAYLFDTQTGRLIFDRTGFAYWFDGSNQGAGFTHTAQAHVLLRLVSTGGEARKDGASIATGLSYTQKAISGQQAIGAVYTGGGSRMTGTIQEFIVWDADKNSAVSTIETNVNNYFSVY